MANHCDNKIVIQSANKAFLQQIADATAIDLLTFVCPLPDRDPTTLEVVYEKWGTKWIDVSSAFIDNDQLVIYATTAWAPPLAAFQNAISNENWRDTHITIFYCEIGNSFAGQAEISSDGFVDDCIDLPSADEDLPDSISDELRSYIVDDCGWGDWL